MSRPLRILVLLLASGALVGGLVALWRPAPRDGAASPRTIVLVTIDTLRRDHAGCYGGRVATPFLDGLAARGVRFDDARTPAPLTLPSHTTMLTGLPPSVHGRRTNSAPRIPPPSSRPWRTVAERFSEAGRCSGAFVSAGPLAARYGLDAGFSAYDDEGLGDLTQPTYVQRPGIDTVARALAWLRAQPADEPVFLWVHLFEPHAPYAPDYDTDVRVADAAVGALLDGLSASGRGDATLLWTSDHGEALGDDGEASHGYLLPESVLRVPFVLVAPGRLAPGVRADPITLADAAPTLLALGGLDPGTTASTGIGFGRNLLLGDVPADRPRVSEGLHAWQQHRWAQLLCATVGPFRLLDRGEGTDRFPLLSGIGGAAGAEATDARGRPEATAPADALRAYRKAEAPPPTGVAVAPGGYGAADLPSGLLDSRENGALVDPYAAIGDVARIDAAAEVLARDPPMPRPVLEAALRSLEAIGTRDPRNPSVPFWRGRLLRALGRHPEALAAFESCATLGRRDPEVLLLGLRSARAASGDAAARGWATARGLADSHDGRILRELADVESTQGHGPEADALRARAEAAGRTPVARPSSGCR